VEDRWDARNRVSMGANGEAKGFGSGHPKEQKYKLRNEQSRLRREEVGYVPIKSHIRVLGPILSPNRPMEAPPRKLSNEHNACWSGVRNSVSPGISHNLASARASYTNR
jgi:hypothetical protein